MTIKLEQDERFVTAVQAHSPAMYRAAWSLLRNSADAEDAVSAAIINCYQSLHRLRSWDAIRAYLIRAAVNAGYDMLRRGQREYATQDMEALHPGAPREETPVWAYLTGLPPKSRLIMQLRYGEEMPVKEIARILRLPRGSVSVTISRTLKLLRKQLEQEEAAHA